MGCDLKVRKHPPDGDKLRKAVSRREISDGMGSERR
jgi:hypothetical protein